MFPQARTLVLTWLPLLAAGCAFVQPARADDAWTWAGSYALDRTPIFAITSMSKSQQAPWRAACERMRGKAAIQIKTRETSSGWKVTELIPHDGWKMPGSAVWKADVQEGCPCLSASSIGTYICKVPVDKELF